jgi:hypothetical protein
MVRSCGLFHKLLGDYDGLYAPTDFNDDRDQPRSLLAYEREQIRALSRDLPELWHAPPPTAADRQLVQNRPICWSPDGRQVLFARFNDRNAAIKPDRDLPGDIFTIWSIGRDGTNLRRLATG